MLSVAGLAAYSMAPLIGLAVAAVLLVVVSSYRQNVHAYPPVGATTRLSPPTWVLPAVSWLPAP